VAAPSVLGRQPPSGVEAGDATVPGPPRGPPSKPPHFHNLRIIQRPEKPIPFSPAAQEPLH